VTGARPQVSAYVAELVRAGIELLGFTATQTPLEALFFMLTDDAEHADAEQRRLVEEVARS
jgi:ABC-2 type transport system ATP-binding protein